MTKNKFILIFWICFYIAIFSVIISNSFSYLDPDFGWHLKVGEQIVREKSVPHFDYYNYPLEGRTWADHEWLANTITYWIYIYLGYPALNILFAIIALAVFIILHISARKYFPQANAFLIALFQILGLLACLPHFGVRMQEISVLNILLLFLIIKHYEKNKNYKILLFIPPLFYLWSSLHGGFLIGVAILFFWPLIKFTETIILTKFPSWSFVEDKNKLKFKQIFLFLIFSVLGLAATFITPYGFELYQFLGGYKNNFYLRWISEWLPIFYLPIPYWQILYEGILVAATILIIIYSFKKKYKLPLWEIALSILFLIMAIKSKRHFPLLFIASFPILIYFLSSFFNSQNDALLNSLLTNNKKENFNKKWGKGLLVIKIYAIIGLLALAANKSLNIKPVGNPFSFFKEKYPYEAVNFLKNNSQYDNLKIFNDYDWGGYLIWAMPERKIFIDGRLPQVSFAGHTFLEEYIEFFKEGGAEEKLKNYNIGLALIKTRDKYMKLNWFEKYFLGFNEEKINKREDHFKNYLNSSSEWQLIYTDNLSQIYAKK